MPPSLPAAPRFYGYAGVVSNFKRHGRMMGQVRRDCRGRGTVEAFLGRVFRQWAMTFPRTACTRHILALRRQPVRVFIGAGLPRAIRIGHRIGRPAGDQANLPIAIEPALQ